MNTQKIQNLQAHFDGLNLVQKREFIEKLKKQLELAEKGTSREY